MKKSLLFYGMLIIFLLQANSQEFSNTTGGTARNIGLGGSPVNPYLEDIIRIHTNPAYIVLYKNVLFGDIGYINTDVPYGSGRTQYLGTVIHIYKNFSAGLILNYRKSPLYNIDSNNPSLDPVRILNGLTYSVLGFNARMFDRPSTPLELILNYEFPSVNFAFSFTFAKWGYQDVSPSRSHKLKNQFFRLKVGSVYDLSESLQLDGAMHLAFNTMNGEMTHTGFQKNELKLDNGLEFEFDTKIKYQVNKNLRFVPIIKYYWFQWGPYISIQGTKPSPNPPVKFTNSIYELGLGYNYQIGRILLVGGLSFQNSSFSQDGKYTNVQDIVIEKITDLPRINFGAEVKITDWLLGRIGYFDRLTTYETREITATGEFPWYGDPNGMRLDQQRLTLGIGVKFSNFSFDGTIGEGLFLRGPWFISGIQQPIFSILSMSYKF